MAKLRVMPEIAGFSATKLQNFSELPTPTEFQTAENPIKWLILQLEWQKKNL